MGLLFVGLLAGILIGFGLLAPSQGYFLPSYAMQPRFDKTGDGQPLEPRPMASQPTRLVAMATLGTPIKPRKKPAPKKQRAQVDIAKLAPPRIKITAAASDHHADIPDLVLSKAKATIAAKMEDPASAEFSDMKRAMRKNTLGRPMDTICGHVKGKNASGEETGERPFLYLVNEDDAYVVDGKPDSAASIAYRNICN
jgi:hypothetical protein